MDFVNAAHYDNGGSTQAVISKPTNTADNDIMFAFLKRVGTTDPSTVPTGWTLVAKGDNGIGNCYWLYRRLAASEGTSYTWEWAAAARTGGTIASFRGGFNTSNIVDVISNTAYVTSDANVRAASMTVSAANSPLLFFGATHKGASAHTFTKPSVPTTDWIEHVDTWNIDSRFSREICSMTWTGSGATGNMDATIDQGAYTDKHAFAVALNPAAGGGGIVANPLRGGGAAANPLWGYL